MQRSLLRKRIPLSIAGGAGAVLACLLAIPGCTNDATDEAVGEAQLEILEVPSDVACIKISAQGNTLSTVSSFDVVPSSSSVLDVRDLPLGAVTFSANAFSSNCLITTHPATWVSDP